MLFFIRGEMKQARSVKLWSFPVDFTDLATGAVVRASLQSDPIWAKGRHHVGSGHLKMFLFKLRLREFRELLEACLRNFYECEIMATLS